MKFTVSLALVAFLVPGHVLAASEYDACVQEESALRAKEKDRCSGFSYILDPSSCFTAQKALKAFQRGRCREIMAAGKAPPVPDPLPAPEAPPSAPAPAAARQTITAPGEECERLKAENARLKAEVERLKTEIERQEKR